MATTPKTSKTKARQTTQGRPPIEGASEAALDATVELLAERGFDGFSMEDVAQRAGLGRMTVYRRWKSREALVVEAVSHAISQASAVGIVDTGDLREDLLQVAHQFHVLMTKSTIGPLLVKLIGASIDDPAWGKSFKTKVGNQRVRTRKILERAVERGQLPKQTDVDLALDLISAPMWFWILVRQRPLRWETTVAAIDLVLAGLGWNPRQPPG